MAESGPPNQGVSWRPGGRESLPELADLAYIAGFHGRVNQMPMFRDYTWGGKYVLRKGVNQVNAPRQNSEKRP